MKAVMFSYCRTLCSFLDWAPSVSHFSVGHCWWMFLNVLKLTVKFYNTLDVNLWGFSSCLHSFLAHSSLASFPCMDNQPLWWCQTDVRLHHQSSQLGILRPSWWKSHHKSQNFISVWDEKWSCVLTGRSESCTSSGQLKESATQQKFISQPENGLPSISKWEGKYLWTWVTWCYGVVMQWFYFYTWKIW